MTNVDSVYTVYLVAAAAVVTVGFMYFVYKTSRPQDKPLLHKSISRVKMMEHKHLNILEGNVNEWLEASEVKPESIGYYVYNNKNVAIVNYTVIKTYKG